MENGQPTNGASTSPVPTVEVDEVQKVNFYTALKSAVEGKKITKLEWNNVNVYLFFNTDTEHLTIHKEDGKNDDLIVRTIDVIGEDWIVLP